MWPANPGRSAEGNDVIDAHARSIGRFIVGLLLAEPFSFHPGQVVLDFAFPLRIAPAKNFSHQLSDNRDRGNTSVPRLDRDAGAPGQDVMDMPGTLMGRGIDDLCRQIVVCPRQRLRHRRVVLDDSEDFRVMEP
ncbi:hypothetical protein AHiyo8_52000 [Arthrobacter sp. Hiyo8]|nr:hypothetical protein AHiyo8_52000 [Arthrobacter sp. Hiyo8]